MAHKCHDLSLVNLNPNFPVMYCGVGPGQVQRLSGLARLGMKTLAIEG